MPTVAEIAKLAEELHSKKLIDLDASLKKLVDVEGLNNLDKKSDLELKPFWHAVVGSSYCLITAE
jgi:hypothetical protein